MSGSPISVFNDFMNTTGPTYLSSADAVINEAVKNTYAFSRLLKEKGTERTVQGGTEIRDVIMFDDGNTYDHYLPNEAMTWQNVQVTDTITAPWRFTIDHMSWTDQEVELNVSEGSSKAAAAVQYKRLKRIKEQRLWTSITNGFEADLWQGTDGNYSEMEGSGGKRPFSIASFITEHLLGDEDDAAVEGEFALRGAAPSGWTNIMGIDPTEENRWSNQVEFYDPNITDPNRERYDADYDGHNTGTWESGGLFPAFDNMFLKCQFVPPSTKQEYFENTKLNRQMILCSRLGVTQYKRALRESNDLLVAPSDPAYNNPTFSGIELMYCAHLDDAALFPAGATQRTATGDNIATTGDTATEPDALDAGARYYWVNGAYLTPIIHSRRYFAKHDVMRSPAQPFTHIQPVDCWWNLFCNSRQRHGIVAPLVAATS
jgi:hypothetical protein